MQVLNNSILNSIDPSLTAQAGSSSSSGGTTPPNTANPTDKLANESTFLKLLMAQIQNQDPLNPTDTTQFMGQLVQFSSLEQLLGINNGIQTLITKSPGTGSTPPPPSGTQNTNQNATNPIQQ